jgi:hypothetical protein
MLGERFPLRIFIFALLLLPAAPTLSLAATVAIAPADDGFIQLGRGVVTDSYLFIVEPRDGEPEDREARGIVEFPTSEYDAVITNALISVNPYGLPLWLPEMYVYGYESDNGQLDLDDWASGELIGTWTLPSNLGFGEEAFFDVTNFLRSVRSPYVGFRLEGLPVEQLFYSANVFSSLEYGKPSQLIVDSLVPEPSTALLMGLGLAGLAGVRKRVAA